MDENPGTNKPPEVNANDLADELRSLGKNLKEVLQSAWESEERKKVQQEIEAGLKDMGATLNDVATEFKQSPTAKRLREEADDLHQRIRTGEFETKARSELLNALRMANAELEKISRKKGSGE